MVQALGSVLDTADDRVLVIDDGSPDGTGDLADRLAGELPWLSVLHRERKEGIGPAYLAGFRRALSEGAELVLEMDCDFSHDPADVPRLIAAAESADLVLGSRYAEGGGTENWGLLRRFVSRAGCLYAQAILGVARARPHRRLQVLPARRTRGDRPRRASPHGATGSRSRRRTGCCAPGSACRRSRSASSSVASATRR